jgi:N-dimethylarginine dimethylaminohydrolase
VSKTDRFGLSEAGPLSRVVIKRAGDAFGSPQQIAAEWRDLGFTAAPDFAAARAEYDDFEAAIRQCGATLLHLPGASAVTLDAIYVRDAVVLTPGGAVLCRMGKPARSGEPAAQAAAYASWGIPVVGAIEPPGTLEGGDVIWLDAKTVCVGRGYRTNDDGIRQLRAFAGPDVEVISVPLPHWRGPTDVFHLMSIISPVDRDLAVVYSPLMPVPFREWLMERGMAFVEVPDDEFETMGANVLALGPRRCLMIDGNPRTQAALERAGADVRVYRGREISLKGGGGPTCLTRPINRRPG